MSPIRRRSSDLKAGQQLPGFAWLKDDGTTSCGNWIYSGSWTEAGHNWRAAERKILRPGHLSELGLVVAGNRRVLYNRASCDPSGKPWDPTRKQIWWNEEAQLWIGNDVPDFKPDSHSERSYGSVHYEPGRRRPHLRASGGLRRRTFPGALRAHSRARWRMPCIPLNRIIRLSRS